MYLVNPARPDIRLNVVRTFNYAAEEPGDDRDGTICVELKSDDQRYGLTVSAEDLTLLPLAD